MKKIIHLVFIALLVLSACNSSDKKPETADETKPTVEINPEHLVSFDLDVSGMTCTGCENTIETGVSEIAGVESIEAIHTDAKAFVTFDSSLTSIEEVTAAIEAKGYKVDALKETSDVETEEMTN